MTTYIDASVLLRNVLGQPDRMDLEPLGACVASDILGVECYRTLDRARHASGRTAEEFADRRIAVARLLRSILLMPAEGPLLRRAGEPMAVPVATLDGIHLATALAYREETGDSPRIATHDRGLAAAARAYGFEVVGV